MRHVWVLLGLLLVLGGAAALVLAGDLGHRLGRRATSPARGA